MAQNSHIQWTDATWNPVAGCRKVSAGCHNCYAMRDAHRLAGNPNAKVAATYAGLTQIQNGRVNWTGTFRELPDRLDQPLRWTKPRRIFVNSMSDLFGEGISDGFITAVFAVMRLAKQHQFQVLTKRPERMAALLPAIHGMAPLSNVWLGTSVEDQRAADARIPALLATPAAVRFLSCEPLLGPVDLSRWMQTRCPVCDIPLAAGACPCGYGYTSRGLGIDWVIAGGESGPGARRMGIEWLLRLATQCRRADVPLFIKQLGTVAARELGLQHPKGGDIDEWPAELQIRQFPEV